jgi:hypothetical protein
MERIAYYDVYDKSDWGDGPWNQEPDKLQYEDETTGLPCLIKRSPVMGVLCGYVGLSPSHPWHGLDYDEVEDSIRVHGGLTFAGLCEEGKPHESSISHIPAPGEPDVPVWWIGFDAGHAFDRLPAMEARERQMGFPPITHSEFSEYRTLEYLQAEVSKLAVMARDASEVSPDDA